MGFDRRGRNTQKIYALVLPCQKAVFSSTESGLAMGHEKGVFGRHRT